MKQWVKDVVKNNRTFRLTFYETMTEGLWCCIGEEIYRKKKNIFDFTWKMQVFEFLTGSNDIIEKALNKINGIFEEEKIQSDIIQSLNNFMEASPELNDKEEIQ